MVEQSMVDVGRWLEVESLRRRRRRYPLTNGAERWKSTTNSSCGQCRCACVDDGTWCFPVILHCDAGPDRNLRILKCIWVGRRTCKLNAITTAKSYVCVRLKRNFLFLHWPDHDSRYFRIYVNYARARTTRKRWKTKGSLHSAQHRVRFPTKHTLLSTIFTNKRMKTNATSPLNFIEISFECFGTDLCRYLGVRDCIGNIYLGMWFASPSIRTTRQVHCRHKESVKKEKKKM